MKIPTLMTIAQFCDKHPCFRQGTLRFMIHQDKNGTGISSTIIRVGRRILIDEEKFFKMIRAIKD